MGQKEKKPLAAQFGARVADMRRQLGMTQESLAERTGISQESLSRMEKGAIAPRFERLQSFADAFNCSVAELFYVGGSEAYGNSLKEMLSNLSDEERKDIMDIFEKIVLFAARRRWHP